MADLDILVRLDEMEKAERSLREYGYESERKTSVADCIAQGHHLPALTCDHLYPIELHWTLADASDGVKCRSRGLWSRSQPVIAYGEPARGLCTGTAATCLYAWRTAPPLWRQGTSPSARRAAILNRYGPTLDWSSVEGRSRHWGIERSVYVMLELARRYCDSQYSKEFSRT